MKETASVNKSHLLLTDAMVKKDSIIAVKIFFNY